MAEQESPLLSVIIPAYNEEDRLPNTIGHVIAYLSDRQFTSEILVVDDGSSDDTGQIVRDWPQSKIPIRLLQHPDKTNHGKGAAVKLGMLQAAGKYRLFMDADSSTTIEQVERFWPLWELGYDLLIGSRKTKGAVVARHQPIYKELAGRFGNLIIRFFAVPGIHDTQAGFKIFSDKSVAVIFPRLTINRWGYDIEILAIARTQGLRFREVPITWIDSAGSKVRMKTYLQVLMEVFLIRWNMICGRYD
jgi:dolichyl-phosphate beta-glucosyltransferase